MPTYEDMPWERDARKREEDRRRGRRLLRKSRRRRGHRQSPMRNLLLTFAFGTIALGIYLTSLPDDSQFAQPQEPRTIETPAEQRVVPEARESAPEPPVATPTPAPRYSLSRLRSRYVAGSAIEIWGQTSAPDGTTIRLYARADGERSRRLGDNPAAAGRFYSKEALPESLLNKSIQISARIIG